jgi:diguanylate cyclase (GGDEF)-like protein
MTSPKLRAALVVFFVGFSLGLSVFAASRLFVRSVLTADAVAAVQDLAGRLARGEPVEAIGTLSSIVRYTYADRAGSIVESRVLGASGEARGTLPYAERLGLSLSALERTTVSHAPILPSLLGLSEPAVRAVAAPVAAEDRLIGTVLAEIDQTLALQSLTRAFSVIGMVTVGLAVLAIIAIAFALTRGRGFVPERKVFDPSRMLRDPLTGAATRAGFLEALDNAVTGAAEADQQVGLMVVDLDRFRAVNDIWGLAIGDDILKLAVERLRTLVLGPAAVARIAGDEFALIVEGDDAHSMRRLAGRIQKALSAPFEVSGRSILVGATIGAALYPANAEDGDTLFRAANTALSKAKAQGRSAFAFFDTEMRERIKQGAELERDIRLALDREEFVVFYQPQLDLASGRLRGYEALVRWERPGAGILSPGEFLPVAEETGLMRPLGNWVLQKACKDAATWLDSGTVAVNFSSAQFLSQEIDKTIAAVLKETGLPADRLEIEVPESLFLEQRDDVMQTLNRIKALGVRVAMDDFGSGYSGLASLASFPFDKIKIDKRFVDQLTADADVCAIIASIVALGRSLSVDITAEGVETTEQVTLLKAAGCSIAQGFLFGAPNRSGSLAAKGSGARAAAVSASA